MSSRMSLIIPSPDGNATDIATITITVTGQNDNFIAVNDTDSVNEGATISRSAGSSYDIDSDDIDVDDSASPVITEIRTGSTEGSGTTGTLGQALTGTYGQLTLNSNGSYTYVANQDLPMFLMLVTQWLIILIIEPVPNILLED